MNTSLKNSALITLLGMFLCLSFSVKAYAETEEDAVYVEERELVEEPMPPANRRRQRKRKYFIEDTSRVDAGVFHVAFGAGGNFYIEPKFDSNNAPLGEYFKDFGFQGGVYFDFDYEDIRLGLRGWVGYKYVLRSVHVFGFEGRVRYLWKMSENVSFGVDIGASAGVWFRTVTSSSLDEEIIFLPAFILGAGFDFNPFMVDFKTLVNRIGQDSTLLGLELTFGFRL